MKILQCCFLVLLLKACIGAERGRQPRRYNEGEVEVLEDNDWNIELMVPGRPNQDYPILNKIPKTSFSCSGKTPGYYADLATECQVFRVCLTGSTFGYQSFLCPNGTLFNQVVSVCDWWMNVNCARTENKYNSNNQQIKTGPKMMNNIKQMLTYPMRNPYSFFNSAPQGNLTMQVYRPPANQMYPRRSAKQTLGIKQNGYQYPRQNLEDLRTVEEIGSNSAEDTFYAASTPSAFYIPTSDIKFDDYKLNQVVQSSLPTRTRPSPFIQGVELLENHQRPNEQTSGKYVNDNSVETISSNKQNVVPKPQDKISYHSWIIPIDNKTIALSPQNIFPFLQAKANLDKDWTNATITLETFVTNNTVRSRTIIKRLKNSDDDQPLSKVDIGAAVSDIIKDTGTILNSSSYTFEDHSQRQTLPAKGGYQIKAPLKQLTYPSPVERLKQIASTYLPPTSILQKSGNLKALPETVTTAYFPPERIAGSSYLPPIYEQRNIYTYPYNQIQRPAQLRATTVSPKSSVEVEPIYLPQLQKENVKYLPPEMLEQFRAVNSNEKIEVNKRLYNPLQLSDKIRQPSTELQPPYIVAEIFTKYHKTANLTTESDLNEISPMTESVMYPLQLNDNITFTLKIPYPILKQIMENKKNSNWNHLEVLHTGDSNYLVLAKKQKGGKNKDDGENYIPLGRLMFNNYFNQSQQDISAINNVIISSKSENVISNRNLRKKQPFEQLRVAPQISDRNKEPVEILTEIKLDNIKQDFEVTGPKHKPSSIQSNKMYSSTYNTRKTLEDYHQKVPNIPNYQTSVTPNTLRGSTQLTQNYAEKYTNQQANSFPSLERHNMNNYQSEDIATIRNQEPSIYNNFENLRLEMEQRRPTSQRFKGEQEDLISEMEQFDENIGSQVELFQQNIQGRDQNYNGKLIMRYPNPNSEPTGPIRGYSYCAGSNNAEYCNENEIVNNPFPKITFPSNGTSQPINKIFSKDNYHGASPQLQFSDKGQAKSGKLIALPRAPVIHPNYQNIQEQYNNQRDAFEEQKLISEAINAQLQKEERAGRLTDSFPSNEDNEFHKVYMNPASNIVTSVQLVPSVEFEIEGEGEDKFIANMANHLINNGISDNYRIAMGDAGPYAVIDLPQSFHPGNSGKNSVSYYVQHFKDDSPISNQALPQQLRMAPEGYPPYGLPHKTLPGLQNTRLANLELEEPDRSYLPTKQVGYPRIRPSVPFTF